MRDPFPFDCVGELIGDAEPSRRSAALHAVWRDYAAKAARPYAWSTFALYARRAATAGTLKTVRAKNRRVREGGGVTSWQDEAPASPRVLVLGAHAALRVRMGALEIEHGPRIIPGSKPGDDGKSGRASIRIDVDARSKPEAILFASHGEFVTGEALRFCARYGIALIWPCGPGRLVTLIETETEARDRKTASKRDVEPSSILAQCAAAMNKRATVAVAREIVRVKIEAQARALRETQARASVEQWTGRLSEARTLGEVLIFEARAAAAYWSAFRDVGLRERKGGELPRSWKRHAHRNRLRAAFRESTGAAETKAGPKNASHPINAMLNYAYVVEAGRLARALAARGLHLSIGFLHKPKRGRNSLVWDAIEPLRPAIDARVFEFVAAHEFGRADFPQAGLNVYRLSRDVTQLMLHSVMLPSRDIEAAADWIEGLILASAKSATFGQSKADAFPRSLTARRRLSGEALLEPRALADGPKTAAVSLTGSNAPSAT